MRSSCESSSSSSSSPCAATATTAACLPSLTSSYPPCLTSYANRCNGSCSRTREMGNAAATAKGSDPRPFSPDFSHTLPFSPCNLSGSPYADDGCIDMPNKSKLLHLQRHSTDDRDNEDDRCADEECGGRVRATTIVNSSINENALPTVFKWEGGGKEVFITGTFSDWKPIKMCPSHGDFVAIVDVPEGVHEYKYIVDGSELINKDCEKDESKSSNVIHVKKCDFEVFEALAMDLASNDKNQNSNNTSFVTGSPPGDYSQELPAHMQARSDAEKGGGFSSGSSSGSGPPILPPHLLQVILNNPNVSSGDSTLLPQPNHVMLNHLYALSIKDGVMVLSCTHRYRKKYVTTLLYKPI